MEGFDRFSGRPWLIEEKRFQRLARILPDHVAQTGTRVGALEADRGGEGHLTSRGTRTVGRHSTSAARSPSASRRRAQTPNRASPVVPEATARWSGLPLRAAEPISRSSTSDADR
jgi:hypothetical protein